MYQRIFEKSKIIVYECGIEIKSAKSKKLHYKKGIHDIVTDIDMFVSNYLKEQLATLVPNSTFIDEEGDKILSENTWVIDPIDGTTNFVNFHYNFTISVAFLKNSVPIFGIVFDVAGGELFSAYHGMGAYCNRHKLKTLESKDISECLWDASYRTILELNKSGAKLEQLMSETRGHRSLGCASLAIIRVAKGELNMYVSSNVKCWDYAAASVILQEANGCNYIHGDFLSINPVIALFTTDEKIMNIMKTYTVIHMEKKN